MLKNAVQTLEKLARDVERYRDGCECCASVRTFEIADQLHRDVSTVARHWADDARILRAHVCEHARPENPDFVGAFQVWTTAADGMVNITENDGLVAELTPEQALEMAKALTTCAHRIQRARMTAADVAIETALRR